MGLMDRMKEMDIKVLRVVIISALVLFFVFCLVLLKIEGQKLGGDTTPPLLKLMEKPAVFRVDPSDVDALNKRLGSNVELLGRVGKVEIKAGQVRVLVGKVWINLDEPSLARLSRAGLSPEDLRGMTIKAKGKLKADPNYGFVLLPSDLVEIVSGKKVF